jgi:hypothetical protein
LLKVGKAEKRLHNMEHLWGFPILDSGHCTLVNFQALGQDNHIQEHYILDVELRLGDINLEFGFSQFL